MAKVIVDGIEVEVANGSTVLQAAEAAGREIPRFCYHERLSIAGNCRMCLVEIEKMPKPVASCGQPVADGMIIKTDTETVRKARRGVMEFLLINHPLDCPICDQGGECDLQDEAVGYGRGYSRYDEGKRAVGQPDWGPLVKTTMTRCIHCTRCIRFCAEVAGVPELGATSRGETMQVGTYVQKALSSELSGNIVDLCPVGALTSKPYAYSARPWELRKTDSVDVLDALGAAIRIDARGADVMRILPRVNDDVNEEWLGDKSRHSVDGLKRRRLDRPWIRENGKLRAATWEAAFAAVAARMKSVAGEKIGAIAGDLCDAESMMALKDMMAALGSQNLDCRQDGAALDAARREFYLFNTTIDGIDQSDAVLFIGTNPRRECPVLNARIRKRWNQGAFSAGLIGEPVDITYPYDHIAAGPAGMTALLDGTHGFAEVLDAAKAPMIIIGQGALRRPDGAAILAAAWKLAAKFGGLTADWHGFNILHTAAARVGALDLGFLPGPNGKPLPGMLGAVDLLWLLGADEFDTSLIRPETFVIYQGHHGDAGAARADVILPGAAYTEKAGTYVNTEGRVQTGFQAATPPGEAREDWKIIRALSAYLGHALPYDTLLDLRARLAEQNPVFATNGTVRRLAGTNTESPAGSGDISDAPFINAVQNYYQTDPISRASPTMAACVAAHHTPIAQAAE
jgi:NADH-quinone oxidoreductase subunit G